VTTVLVTGATGFVGRHTIEPLCGSGCDVHAVSRTPRQSLHGERWHTADLFDTASRRELLQHAAPERLLHLAWTVEHGRFWHDPANLAWLEMTSAFAEEFADAGGHRLVAAGTCAEYDWSALAGQACRELETPCRPRTLYGTTKHRLRLRLEALAQRRAVGFAWGRLFHLFGPGEHRERLVPALALALLEERTAATGPGTVARDFMDVRDAGEAFAALLLSDVDGPVNIASGAPTTIAGLAETLADSVGRRDLLSIGSLARRSGDPLVLYADVERLATEVNFRPARAQRAALQDTVAWWRHKLAAKHDNAPSAAKPTIS
jgi:nucleoside-diphosphate-sugar epimerase